MEFLFYMRRAPGTQIMPAVNFCEMILAHANLAKPLRRECIERTRSEFASVRDLGFNFQEVLDFFRVLRDIDSLKQAVSLYDQAGTSISERVFRRAAKAVTGSDLNPRLVHAVFVCFDADGDHMLDHDEFIKVMATAANRGLDDSRDLGVTKGLQALLFCVRRQLSEM